MLKHLNAKMCGLALIMALVGCRVEYHSERPLPDSPKDLKVMLAEENANIEGQQLAVTEMTKSRDAAAKSAENAVGFYAKDTAGNKLERTSSDLEWSINRLTRMKARAAAIKAKLETTE